MDEHPYAINDGMLPWGHSDYEFLTANPNMTDIISNLLQLLGSIMKKRLLKNSLNTSVALIRNTILQVMTRFKLLI